VNTSHLSPKISIVTINYNRLADLKKTFDSVIAQQNFDECEYIAIDGGSSDGSEDFLRENSDSIARWVSEPDRGIYDAMNKGANLASGEWIIFMNAGDCFHSADTLQQVAAYLKSDIDVILGSVESIYTDRYGYRSIVSQPTDVDRIWHQIPACHQSVIVRRELQIQYPFDSSLSWCADHDFLAKLYSLEHRFKVVPIVIAKFEATGDRRRSLLSYTTERWQIYRRYFDRTWSREWFFINEYRSFWIQQNINSRIRELMPREWVIYFRKARKIY
jgi:glycosyltransferase involved in cell wall biosynthesis